MRIRGRMRVLAAVPIPGRVSVPMVPAWLGWAGEVLVRALLGPVSPPG
ncbi:MAG TPA: hypothetical protein VH637_18075 [Streptosporangiaceae bacterium]